MNELHELCANAVRWAGNCPEATVGTWIVSGILMVVQGVLLVRRLIAGKPEPQEVISPVVYPYVPSDTILKLLKLLNSQEAGWALETGDANNQALTYCNLRFKNWYGNISVQHNQTTIDLARKSEEPALDQQLLKEAFQNRLRKERDKIKAKRALQAAEAEKVANHELASVLDTI
jgi:hypothetical protein